MTNEHRLLEEFLAKWPLPIIEKLKLNEYVGLGNKDTFCQWVETKTRSLGSIKGLTSIKFGIYERKPGKTKPKNYNGDERLSWLKSFNSKSQAYSEIHDNIIKIIKAADEGKFEEIDGINIPSLFKWKVAFLYSNERLIPVYKKELLLKIGRHYGLATNRKTKISEIQRVMMENKPAEFDVFRYMWFLMNKFATRKDNEEVRKDRTPRGRRAATSRNTEKQTRTVSKTYVAEQKHNKIQEALEKLLIEKYGKKNVILEKNFVDIKVIEKERISLYEVKSAAYASDCVRQALGQILMYYLREDDTVKKHIYIAGQFTPTKEDQKFISFVKKNLKISFDYISVPI